MKNNFLLKGFAFNIRSVVESDAQEIIKIRLFSKERNKFIHKTSSRLEVQKKWLEKYFKRDNDFYFVVENRKTKDAEGLISIYNIDFKKNNDAELGRWVLYPHSLASVESIYLSYKFSFEKLNLDKVYTRTVANNTKVVSFHKSIGAEEKQRIPNFFEISDKKYDAIEQFISIFKWKEIKPKLEKLCASIASKI